MTYKIKRYICQGIINLFKGGGKKTKIFIHLELDEIERQVLKTVLTEYLEINTGIEEKIFAMHVNKIRDALEFKPDIEI